MLKALHHILDKKFTRYTTVREKLLLLKAAFLLLIRSLLLWKQIHVSLVKLFTAR